MKLFNKVYGPGGLAHVGANIRYFNANFNILYVKKSAFVGKKKEFHVIKMHGTRIKKIEYYKRWLHKLVSHC